MKRLFAFFLLSSLMQGSVSSAFAQSPVIESGIFTIPPWGLINADGAVSGVTVDTLDAIGGQIGVSFKHNYLPFKRMVRQLATGKLQISAFYRDTNIQADDVFPLAFVHDDNVIVVGLHATEFNTYDDIIGLTVALPRGAHYLEKFDNDPAIQKIFTRGHDQSVKLLLSNRVDAIAGSERAIRATLNNQGVLNADLGTSYFLAKHEVWVHVSNRHTSQNMKDRIHRGVRLLRNKGVFEEILSRYFH